MKEKNIKKEEKKEKKIALIVLLVCLVFIAIAVAYAMFSQIYLGEKTNQIQTGTLILDLDDSMGDGINLTDAVPVSDAVGLRNPSYTFTLKNIGSNNSQYRIKLVDDEAAYESDGCSSNRLQWSNIKYSFTKNESVTTMGLLSANSGVFDSGVLNAGDDSKNTYTLTLWINSEATNEIMGKHFHGRIQVEAIVEGHTDYSTGE